MDSNGTPTDFKKAIEQLDAFKMGVLVSLGAIKAAMQASPGFNQQALEDSVLYFLAQPPDTKYREDFEWPLKTLMQDMSDLLKQMKHLE